MLFGPEPAPLWEHLPGQRPLALIFSIILLVGLVTAVNVPALTGTPGTLTEAEIATVGNPTLIGLALYQRYAVPFEVTSVLLLVAMIGAVVLAKRDRSETVGSTSDAAIAATDTSLQRIPADAASAAD